MDFAARFFTQVVGIGTARKGGTFLFGVALQIYAFKLANVLGFTASSAAL